MNERTAVDLVPNLIRGHGRTGRTAYDMQAKRELVRRCMQPGVSVAGTALAHGINANLLRRWITLESGAHRRSARQTKLVAVATRAERSAAQITHDWAVELIIGAAVVRVRDGVQIETLRAVLACLASRA